MLPSHAYQIEEGEGKYRWSRSCQLVERKEVTALLLLES